MPVHSALTLGRRRRDVSNIVYSPFLNYLRVAVAAQDALVHYVQTSGRTSLDTDEFQDTADGQATVVVVFTVIALECYIHNYATRKLGENYTKKHVESMGHHTKWCLVPKLATGKSIPADHKSLALLHDLIFARNLVVHAKAVNVSPDIWGQQKERIIASNQTIMESALQALQCVGQLGSALASLDPGEPSAKFLAKFTDLRRLSLQVKPKTN